VAEAISNVAADAVQPSLAMDAPRAARP